MSQLQRLTNSLMKAANRVWLRAIYATDIKPRCQMSNIIEEQKSTKAIEHFTCVGDTVPVSREHKKEIISGIKTHEKHLITLRTYGN